MARGTTLGQMVTMLREEIGDATSAALGQNNLAHLKRILQRTQSFLWNDHAWPHLRVYREEALQAGQQFYTFPADLSFDRIENVWVRYDEDWRPMLYGIEAYHYNASDPELNDREDPPLRWQAHEDGQFEVWPIPVSNGIRMRFEGIKKLAPFIADGDRADLDDDLVVLFAAVELLRRRDAKDSEAKTSVANRLYTALKGQQSGKKGMFVMGGGHDPNMGPRYDRPRPRFGKRI